MKPLPFLLLLSCMMPVMAEEVTKFKFTEGVDGIQWGTSLDNVKTIVKDSSGGIRLPDGDVLMFMGMRKAYRFNKNVLSGVTYGMLFDFTILEKYPQQMAMRNAEQVSDGITMGSDFETVNKILGGKLGNSANYQIETVIDNCHLGLRFSVMDNNGVRSYVLHSITIDALTPKSSNGDTLKGITPF